MNMTSRGHPWGRPRSVIETIFPVVTSGIEKSGAGVPSASIAEGVRAIGVLYQIRQTRFASGQGAAVLIHGQRHLFHVRIPEIEREPDADERAAADREGLEVLPRRQRQSAAGGQV